MTMDQALVFVLFAATRLVTNKQVRRLFALVNLEKNQEIAAAKAGRDRKTARKYLRARRLPSELPQAPRQRTRADAFGEGCKSCCKSTLGWKPRRCSSMYSGSIPAAFRMDSYARCSVGSKYGGRRMGRPRRCFLRNGTILGG